MPEYTIGAVVACVLVVAAEWFWWKTGLLRQKTYWLTMVIVVFFQILVDGRLTKLSDPVVIYAGRFMSGWRFPFDIPIEDYGFGFALVTLALLLWVRDPKQPPG